MCYSTACHVLPVWCKSLLPPGFEPRVSHLQDRHPNHYTTASYTTQHRTQFSGTQHGAPYWPHCPPLADPQHPPAGLLPVPLRPHQLTQTTEPKWLVKVCCHRDSNRGFPACKTGMLTTTSRQLTLHNIWQHRCPKLYIHVQLYVIPTHGYFQLQKYSLYRNSCLCLLMFPWSVLMIDLIAHRDLVRNWRRNTIFPFIAILYTYLHACRNVACSNVCKSARYQGL